MYKPPGQLYALESCGGCKMHLQCAQPESFNASIHPTVLFFHGLRGSSQDFSWIYPQVNEHTRACVFDRLGYGWSEGSKKENTPRDSATMAVEIEEALNIAAISGDFVIVGHSFAGFNIPAFMRQIRNSTSRTVNSLFLLDVVDPQLVDNRGFNSFLNPTSAINAFGLYVLPIGLTRLVIDLQLFPEASIYNNLPNGKGTPIFQHLATQRFFDAQINEWKYWPWSAETAYEDEVEFNFNNVPTFVYSATNGLNNQRIANISNHSELTLVDSDHFFLFREPFAVQVRSKIIQYLNSSFSI